MLRVNFKSYLIINLMLFSKFILNAGEVNTGSLINNLTTPLLENSDLAKVEKKDKNFPFSIKSIAEELYAANIEVQLLSAEQLRIIIQLLKEIQIQINEKVKKNIHAKFKIIIRDSFQEEVTNFFKALVMLCNKKCKNTEEIVKYFNVLESYLTELRNEKLTNFNYCCYGM